MLAPPRCRLASDASESPASSRAMRYYLLYTVNAADVTRQSGQRSFMLSSCKKPCSRTQIRKRRMCTPEAESLSKRRFECSRLAACVRSAAPAICAYASSEA